MSSLRSLIREDFASHGRDWTKPGFRALAVYRFGVWRMSIRNPFIRAPLSILYRAAYRYCRNIYGIELPYSAKIGRRVVIEHQSGIVIHGASLVGDDCIIRQNCTLGMKNAIAPDEAPTLLENVELGAGATILGAVVIGARAKIGANAVVTRDVPADAVAIGIPARIIFEKGVRKLPAASGD